MTTLQNKRKYCLHNIWALLFPHCTCNASPHNCSHKMRFYSTIHEHDSAMPLRYNLRAYVLCSILQVFPVFRHTTSKLLRVKAIFCAKICIAVDPLHVLFFWQIARKCVPKVSMFLLQLSILNWKRNNSRRQCLPTLTSRSLKNWHRFTTYTLKYSYRK